MRQIVFEFLRSQSSELRVPLDERRQAELVKLMAAAITAIHTERVEVSDDTCSRGEQDHGETLGT